MTGLRGLLLAAALVLACDHDEDDAGQFIALQHDFAGFRDWMVVYEADGPMMKGHPAGPRTVYTPALPEADGEQFATGTIIVKVIETDTSETGHLIHAMAKRGGDFNPKGRGWEWFELDLDARGQTVIVWRGATPPDGDCYGCPPGYEPSEAAELIDCNNCHLAAGGNDLVHTLDRP